MTVVVSQKQRIHYRFEGEKGAYLLLHHGLLGSHQDWYDAGYVDALRDEFRLIVMDARGHGRSDRPLDPAQYALETLVDDVIAVMDELDIRNLHFFGYSLGALVGFELLMRHPERVRIVMLGGEAPFLSPTVQARWRELAAAIGQDGLPAVRRRMEIEGWRVAVPSRSPLPPEPAALEGEALAAQALLQALADQVPRADEGRISVDSPVALFTGETDPALDRIRDARRRIHRARFVSMPGQSHTGLFLEREALIREIVQLLRPGRKDGTGVATDGQAGAGADSTGNGHSTPEEPSDGPQRGQGSGGGHNRGRGARGREGSARRDAPLAPPPPVEVPTHAPGPEAPAPRNPEAEASPVADVPPGSAPERPLEPASAMPVPAAVSALEPASAMSVPAAVSALEPASAMPEPAPHPSSAPDPAAPPAPAAGQAAEGTPLEAAQEDGTEPGRRGDPEGNPARQTGASIPGGDPSEPT